MNNKKESSNYTRYDFNIDSPSQRQPRSKFSGWWFAIIVLLIALLIGVSVSRLQNPKKSARDSINNDPITKSVNGKLATEVQNQQVAKFQNRLNQEDNNGITVSQRKKMQSLIDQTTNKSVKRREQSILNNTQTKAAVFQPKKKTVPNKPKPTPKDTPFSTDHTFTTIEDAKNWANTTKSQWLAAGYTNYTITTNGQGYYNLTFVK
ncbi:hypothetical protein [Lentilactobacillus kosonis]|uniref:Streptococcal hemagglutinin protein n=1 Tax=Lentilactobacillus kosonis TaxID=2810561 RepID=A0A401FM03_9LACO|nr:hypothetical protein [Lentilactobacillus kosonis]GAY73412.1 streptococcal hemagglutinin protein [Lentilactobacillus kosonis]